MINFDTIQNAAEVAVAKDHSPMAFPYKHGFREGFIDGALWAQKQLQELQEEIEQLRQAHAEYQKKA